MTTKSLKVQVGGEHYKKCSIQPIDYIVQNNLSFIEGNIVKYTTRHADKNGQQDALKVLHYAFMLLENEYGLSPEQAYDKVFNNADNCR